MDPQAADGHLGGQAKGRSGAVDRGGVDDQPERRRPHETRRPAHPRVSVVVPALNEAANVREILPYLSGFYEVIVVDGHSVDGTAVVAREALPTAKVITQTRKGKGNALACGFAVASGDAIVMFDVDGSADPHEIPRFIDALVSGADLAKGSRFIAGGGSHDITLIRRVGNAGLNGVASALTNSRFTDLCYGFNAFWADQLYMLDLPSPDEPASREMLRGDGFEIEALIIGRFALSGAKITEVPSHEYLRYHGETNLDALKDGFRVLHTILRDRTLAQRIRAKAKRRTAGTELPDRPGWMRDADHLSLRRPRRLEEA